MEEKQLDDLPVGFILAYVPDWTGLNMEEAAAIALQKDEIAADNLERDALELFR